MSDSLPKGMGVHTQYMAGWSSSVACRVHYPKVVGSNPTPAPIDFLVLILILTEVSLGLQSS